MELERSDVGRERAWSSRSSFSRVDVASVERCLAATLSPAPAVQRGSRAGWRRGGDMPVVAGPAHRLHRAVEISRAEAMGRRMVDGETAELGWRVAGIRCILREKSQGAAVARCLWRAGLIAIDREHPPRSVLIGIGDVN